MLRSTGSSIKTFNPDAYSTDKLIFNLDLAERLIFMEFLQGGLSANMVCTVLIMSPNILMREVKTVSFFNTRNTNHLHVKQETVHDTPNNVDDV